MLGGIVGDVLGSVYEGFQWKNRALPLVNPQPSQSSDIIRILKKATWVRDTPHWTDDSLCALALFKTYRDSSDPTLTVQAMCRHYFKESIGFGKGFTHWLEDPVPYQSTGNGALMRIGFISFLPENLSQRLFLAEQYTAISHDHPESFRAVRDYIMLSHQLTQNLHHHQAVRDILETYLKQNNYSKTIDDLHQEQKFEMNVRKTLFQAVRVVLESQSFEDILRNAFYVGGDSDTLACIAGNLGSILFPIPEDLLKFSLQTFDPYPELQGLIQQFQSLITPDRHTLIPLKF